MRIEKTKAKICMLGDATVGKTSLVNRFVYDEFNRNSDPEFGEVVTKKKMLIPFIERGMDVEMDVKLFDIIGKTDFKNLVKDAYLFNADGFLAVCDTTNEDTLNGLFDWIDEGRRVAGNIPVHVLLNKADLKKKKVIRDYNLTKLCEDCESLYNYTSAKSGVNVEKGFTELIEMIAREQIQFSDEEDFWGY
ncbi:MAG: GTP-binding protein [Thermoplasmata archaeon]|nr:GTP-binding protein [Thermoplasmata archaeon]